MNVVNNLMYVISMLHVRIQLDVMSVTASVDSQGMVSLAKVRFFLLCINQCIYFLYSPHNIFIFSDIDECADSRDNNCSSNANCSDTIGSYACTCKVGYTGDGFTCEGTFKQAYSIISI